MQNDTAEPTREVTEVKDMVISTTLLITVRIHDDKLSVGDAEDLAKAKSDIVLKAQSMYLDDVSTLLIESTEDEEPADATELLRKLPMNYEDAVVFIIGTALPHGISGLSNADPDFLEVVSVVVTDLTK